MTTLFPIDKINKCDCFAVAIIGGHSQLCRVEVLSEACWSIANTDYIGLNLPVSEILKSLKFFKKFKYCPKCGQKIKFDSIEQKIKTIFESTNAP